MTILAIETSCDETAISILEFKSSTWTPDVQVEGRVLSHLVSSQVEMHKEWGGVVPNIAKREHQKTLIPLLKQGLVESGLITPPTPRLRRAGKSQARNNKQTPNSKIEILNEILDREPELLIQAKDFLPTIEVPGIDAIAVTHGPGLEPALWVGVNFAKDLSTVWQKPLIPINHLEGHLVS